MIAKEFEDYLLEHEETFLTPGENLAVMIDTHNVDHAILLLSQMTYSRVPVVTADKSCWYDFLDRHHVLSHAP